MKSRALELMKLYDGELDEREQEELESSLTEEELGMLEGLEQVGDVVRAVGDDTSSHAGDIAGAVMDRIGQGEATEKVVQLPVPPRKRRAAVLAAGLGLAAAAAGIVWLQTAAPPAPPTPVTVTSVRGPAPEPIVPPVAPAPAPEAVEPEPSPAASIEAVDFGNNAGSIFMVPSGDESMPVVWLVDEPSGGRMEQL